MPDQGRPQVLGRAFEEVWLMRNEDGSLFDFRSTTRIKRFRANAERSYWPLRLSLELADIDAILEDFGSDLHMP